MDDNRNADSHTQAIAWVNVGLEDSRTHAKRRTGDISELYRSGHRLTMKTLSLVTHELILRRGLCLTLALSLLL